jgi:hypothetical protein
MRHIVVGAGNQVDLSSPSAPEPSGRRGVSPQGHADVELTASSACGPSSAPNRPDASGPESLALAQGTQVSQVSTSTGLAAEGPSVRAQDQQHNFRETGSGEALESELRRRPSSGGRRSYAGGDCAEAAEVLQSRTHGLTFVTARCVLRAADGSHWARRLLIEWLYGGLRAISYESVDLWSSVHEDALDVTITYRV